MKFGDNFIQEYVKFIKPHHERMIEKYPEVFGIKTANANS